MGTTRIRLGCGSCGDIAVDADGVRLMLDAPAERSVVLATCPRCSAGLESVADSATEEMLLALGVRVVSERETAPQPSPVEATDSSRPVGGASRAPANRRP